MKFPSHLFDDSGVKPDQKDYATTSHIRELYTRLEQYGNSIDNLERKVESIEVVDIPTITGTVAPMTNFVDNSDFTFSHGAYSLATDGTAFYILARWYARPQSVSSAYEVNTTITESPESVRSSDGFGGTVAYTSITANEIFITNAPTVLADGMEVTITGSSLSSSTKYVIVDATATSVKLATTAAPTVPITVTAAAGGTLVKDFSPTEGGRKVLWDTDSGSLSTLGGYRLASPLTSKYVFLGNLIYVKMQLAHKPRTFTVSSVNAGDNTMTIAGHGLENNTHVTVSSDGSVPGGLSENTVYHVVNKTTDTIQVAATEGGSAIDLTTAGSGVITLKTRIKPGLVARISLWDNGAEHIYRGDAPTLTAVKIGSHSGGTTSRDYILEVLMPNGQKFYSSIATVTNTVNPATVDNDDYVSVSWEKISGASRYSIYRSVTGSSSWYEVETVAAGRDLIFDYGAGTSAPSFSYPTTETNPLAEKQLYMMADAIIENATDEVSTSEFAPVELNSSIQFPSVLNDESAAGDQFVQIEFLKADGTYTDLSDIPLNSLLVDKVALSYVYGRWQPSARDQALVPSGTLPVTPIAGGGGVDGTGTPPVIGGGGTETGGGLVCVHYKTPVLMWGENGEHRWFPASDIVIGDKLVAWNGTEVVPSRVVKITNGVSRMNYRVYAEDKELVCSFSHRVIANMGDFDKGTNVGSLDSTVVVYKDGTAKLSEIQGLESFSEPMKVVTFRMEKGLENYVSAGIFSHNRKSEYEPEVVV